MLNIFIVDFSYIFSTQQSYNYISTQPYNMKNIYKLKTIQVWKITKWCPTGPDVQNPIYTESMIQNIIQSSGGRRWLCQKDKHASDLLSCCCWNNYRCSCFFCYADATSFAALLPPFTRASMLKLQRRYCCVSNCYDGWCCCCWCHRCDRCRWHALIAWWVRPQCAMHKWCGGNRWCA